MSSDQLSDETKQRILKTILRGFLDLKLLSSSDTGGNKDSTASAEAGTQSSEASTQSTEVGTAGRPVKISDEDELATSYKVMSVQQLVDKMNKDKDMCKHIFDDLHNEGIHDHMPKYKAKIVKLNDNLGDPGLKEFLTKEKNIEKDILNESQKRDLLRNTLDDCLRSKDWKC